MRKPFEKIVRQLADSETADLKANLTIGQLAERHECDPERIMDALDVLKMLRGQATYIPGTSTNVGA
jgi:hypothetical protein